MPVIGEVTKQRDGSYKGELHTMTIRAPLEFRPNRSKTKGEPDFRVFSNSLEIGSARSSEPGAKGRYISVSIALPEFGRRPVRADLVPAGKRRVSVVYSLCWQPEEQSQ